MKKAISLLLAVMLVLSLSACGGNETTHTHSYSDATCAAPAKCSCGATNGSALGHSYSNATCTEAKKCSRCGATNGSALGHSYKDATCTEPKTCTKCGATNGSALGHSYKDATCTEPKTCTKCGATSGNALGHKEVVDKAVSATCTKAGLSEGKHCSTCNTVIVAQETIPATHQYADATCTEPQKCKLCGSTYGTHNGHDFSRSNSCSSCGMWLSDLFDITYSSGSYNRGDRNSDFASISITSCSQKYYSYNNSVTLTIKATGKMIYTWSYMRPGVVSYQIGLYKDGVLYATSSTGYVNCQKGETDSETFYIYDVEPGTYTIKIL